VSIYLAYVAFCAVAIAIFFLLEVRRAILVVFLGGWLLLPVTDYPPQAIQARFPYWITGAAVPSDLLVTKAWIVSVVAFAGAALRDIPRLRAWHPRAIDAPIVLWCLWPLVSGLLAARPDPSPILASFYVVGCWGLPWLLGRIWFTGQDGGLSLIDGLAGAGLACLPFALLEGALPAWLYGLLYELHPFRNDGVDRYVGYRPLGFFENGNQYGIWVSLCALAFLWRAASIGRFDQHRHLYMLGAAISVAIALAAQSVGAILLLVAGLAVIATWRFRALKAMAFTLAAMIAIVGAVHLSGIVPLKQIARETPMGRELLGAVRATGRGSFAWRISQDSKALSAVHASPLTGSARWDWWRVSSGSRPWGLAMLLIGQYGLIGLALAFGGLLAPVVRALSFRRAESGWRADAVVLPLGVIVLLALFDALLNSFFFFPAILAAGAIAVQDRQRATTRR